MWEKRKVSPIIFCIVLTMKIQEAQHNYEIFLCTYIQKCDWLVNFNEFKFANFCLKVWKKTQDDLFYLIFFIICHFVKTATQLSENLIVKIM